MPRYFPLLALTLLTGCSTFSKRECAAMDWTSQGYLAAIDAREKQAALSHYQKECGEEHGISPDPSGFDRGYASGLEILCTQSGGIELGRKGLTYQQVCPATKEKEVLAGYQIGRLEFIGNRVAQLEEEVRRLRNQLHQKDAYIRDLESRLSRSGL